MDFAIPTVKSLFSLPLKMYIQGNLVLAKVDHDLCLDQSTTIQNYQQEHLARILQPASLPWGGEERPVQAAHAHSDSRWV